MPSSQPSTGRAVELPAAITVSPEPCSVTDLLPAAPGHSLASLQGWGPWQSHSPLGVPFQGSAGGAGPQSTVLAAHSAALGKSLPCPAASQAGSGRTPGLPSCAPLLHPITLAKGAGLACCRLCLQLLSWAVWKPYT